LPAWSSARSVFSSSRRAVCGRITAPSLQSGCVVPRWLELCAFKFKCSRRISLRGAALLQMLWRLAAVAWCVWAVAPSPFFWPGVLSEPISVQSEEPSVSQPFVRVATHLPLPESPLLTRPDPGGSRNDAVPSLPGTVIPVKNRLTNGPCVRHPARRFLNALGWSRPIGWWCSCVNRLNQCGRAEARGPRPNLAGPCLNHPRCRDGGAGHVWLVGCG